MYAPMVLSPDMQENDTMLDTEETGVIDTGGDESPISVYEVGYHLVPTLSEDAVPQSVGKLMDLLKGEGADFVGEHFPSKIQLAYPISKRLSGKHATYDSAYFGWVAFEVRREVIAKLKAFLDGNADVLRYLVITTSRDEVAASMSGETSPTPSGNIEKPKRSDEEGGEVSEAALDQALETMQAEDAKTE